MLSQTPPPLQDEAETRREEENQRRRRRRRRNQNLHLEEEDPDKTEREGGGVPDLVRVVMTLLMVCVMSALPVLRLLLTNHFKYSQLLFVKVIILNLILVS